MMLCKECDEEFKLNEYSECPWCGSDNCMINEDIKGGAIG